MKIKQNHIWLFAFTDLAFLLVLTLSMIPSGSPDICIHFSQMDIPVIPSNPNMSAVDELHDVWELHVYAKSENHPTPFKLVEVGLDQNNLTELYSKYLDQDDLIIELESLKKRNICPMLLPEKKSLSQNFLFAAGSIAKVWMSVQSHTIVKPMPE
ncbi:MAG: hypothetical protein HF982_10550 [Desulfobacteraceae bacterium]|nr:hypothetical protein [Desulfobacteraceae bacterium]MBC2720006.1 hypothetical protein [Desulfobacteraceae bacterium]